MMITPTELECCLENCGFIYEMYIVRDHKRFTQRNALKGRLSAGCCVLKEVGLLQTTDTAVMVRSHRSRIAYIPIQRKKPQRLLFT